MLRRERLSVEVKNPAGGVVWVGEAFGLAAAPTSSVATYAHAW